MSHCPDDIAGYEMGLVIENPCTEIGDVVIPPLPAKSPSSTESEIIEIAGTDHDTGEREEDEEGHYEVPDMEG